MLVDFFNCFLHKFLSPEFNNTTGGRVEHLRLSHLIIWDVLHSEEGHLHILNFANQMEQKVFQVLTRNPLLAGDMGPRWAAPEGTKWVELAEANVIVGHLNSQIWYIRNACKVNVQTQYYSVVHNVTFKESNSHMVSTDSKTNFHSSKYYKVSFQRRKKNYMWYPARQ